MYILKQCGGAEIIYFWLRFLSGSTFVLNISSSSRSCNILPLKTVLKQVPSTISLNGGFSSSSSASSILKTDYKKYNLKKIISAPAPGFE